MISQSAYDRAALAREELMHKCLFDEVEVAFDARCEDMRDELRGHLQVSPRVDVVFSPSGTDSQLHALFLARAVLGASPVTIVVGTDQTGSGTPHTARGHHFSTMTASGFSVRKDGAVAGLAGDGVAVPLLDTAPGIAMRSDADEAVLRAVETSLAQGRRVLLQIMDSSKLAGARRAWPASTRLRDAGPARSKSSSMPVRRGSAVAGCAPISTAAIWC
ncbi:hypothetical protein ABIF34_004666 [Bradyrhizobium japonicum]